MIIERRYAGAEKPLKKALPELFPELAYSEIQAALRRRDVKVDGVRASADFSLRGSALVTIYPKKKKEIKILYEDDNLLACYKPKGIASEGALSFESQVQAEKGSVRLMHRLDTNTDGVILFAKNDIAYREIFSAMKEGLIRKEYICEVYGRPEQGKEVSLDYFYKKDAEKGRAMIASAPKNGYLPVHISFRVLKSGEETATLSVILHKGKMHQIRAMLAHYGTFILGDGKYGSDKVNRRLGVSRTMLTAKSLSFSFPQNSPLFYMNETEISFS